MIDPLAEIVTLLQPHASYAKMVSASGQWRVKRNDTGKPFYCVAIDGNCELTIDGAEAISLQSGDFVLIPESFGFTVSSMDPRPLADMYSIPQEIQPGRFVVGEQHDQPTTCLLVGHCIFSSPDSALLVSLLPKLIHIRGVERLTTLVKLVVDESREQRVGREPILTRLLEVLFIEALRINSDTIASSGLIRGLADERLARAIGKMHEEVNKSWTVAQLAKEAALSRSAFFQKFTKTVGFTPMEYLVAWRMALAKNLLRQKVHSMSEIAERIGYKSSSAFSVAFSRHSGQSPSQFMAIQSVTLK